MLLVVSCLWEGFAGCMLVRRSVTILVLLGSVSRRTWWLLSRKPPCPVPPERSVGRFLSRPSRSHPLPPVPVTKTLGSVPSMAPSALFCTPCRPPYVSCFTRRSIPRLPHTGAAPLTFPGEHRKISEHTPPTVQSRRLPLVALRRPRVDLYTMLWLGVFRLPARLLGWARMAMNHTLSRTASRN